MSKADVVAGIMLTGATLYAVFGGADFGAGFWSLIAGGGERGKRPRELVGWAIGPVWEANHVWLIFVLVVLWTGFPEAFASIFSTLFIPLSLAALGIVLRGAGFAFQGTARRLRGRVAAQRLFGASSLLTPFFMGTVVGAIASGRVPVGNAAGDEWSSWLNAVSLLVGALFVATSAYLAAVFLVSDARRAGAADLERYFTSRAIVTALAAGALATAGLIVLHSDARYLYDRLTSEALPLVLLSVVCGVGALVTLHRRSTRGTRPLAVGAVVAVLWGWGVAQFPYLLPESLKISQGAANSDTLTMVLIVFGIAVVLVLPALALLYTLAQRSVITESEGPLSERLSAAEFQDLFDELRTWEAWPEHPERGALNHLGAAQIVAAAGLVSSGTTVTLSLPLSTDVRPDSPQPADHHMTMMPDEDIGSGSVRFAKDYIGADYHNEGHTHLDAFSHVSYEGLFYGGEPDTSVTEHGAESGAVDLLENGLIGRGVLLDIARLRGVAWLEPGAHVHVEDLEDAERSQGTTVQRGDILLVRTGHARHVAAHPEEAERGKPGLHPAAARFLAQRGVAALGSDGNNDTVPSTTDGVGFPIHVLALNALGVHLLDYLQFEDVVPVCEREGRWEFLFVAAPLRVRRGTGSPLNPIAIF